MITMKELVQLVSSNQNENINLWHYLGNFLDAFYYPALTSEERFALVADEPDQYENITQRDYAFLAGTVHKICLDYKVRPPEWVIKPKYFLDKPVFSLDAKGTLRIVLLVESPYEFRMRNIFTSANTLDRA